MTESSTDVSYAFTQVGTFTDQISGGSTPVYQCLGCISLTMDITSHYANCMQVRSVPAPVAEVVTPIVPVSPPEEE
jgi:hypothetical protein